MPARALSGTRSYFRFLADHRRLLAFGLLTATLSGFGQTFYIGFYNAELRAAFGLSHGGLGLVYGAATLLSAALLTRTGRLYDRLPLPRFLTGTAVALAAGCVVLASAGGVAALFLALFLLRQAGQGLMGHIAMTTMARRFHGGRGKALSVAAMGFPLAEAAFPAAGVALLAVTGWRNAWWLGAAAVLAVFLPLLLWLLREARGGDAPEHAHAEAQRDWTLRQAVRDPRFALVMPAAVAAPFVVTVVFFHQVPLAAAKGWPLELLATGLSFFALGHVAGLVGGGPLVDRFTAARVLTPALTPMVAALAVLGALDAAWAALTWPALLGLGLGLSGTAVSALLAELYGVTHLGAIRAVLQALMILSTAIGPPVVGALLDAGVGTRVIALGIGAGVAVAAGMAWVAVGRRHGG